MAEYATRFSRKVYTTEAAARAAMPDFLKRLERRDDHDLGYLESIDEVRIVELELIKGKDADTTT